jgi:hypothetical protein
MKFTTTSIAFGLGIFFLSGCVDNEAYINDLRDAMAGASLSLIEAVPLAEAEVGDGVCVRAELDVSGDPVFSVGAVANGQLNDVRIDTVSGEILSNAPKAGYSGDLCPDAISMVDALAIAEDQGNGVAVAVVPDDDVACAREIQVLEGSNLWEVKVGADGTILEYEESDEGGGEDDD